MRRFAAWLGTLRGWHRAGAAMLAGALSALAMAPLHLWPVLALTFPVLVWLLDGCARAPRAAAAAGWCFGFGYFLAGLYWIGAAFLVDAARFGWLLPFAVSLMPAGLALFHGAAAALGALAWRPGVSRLLALAMSFALAEWARGHVLTGFPWNLIGYALTGGEAMMQWAAVFGAYGLSLLAVLIFTAPALIWDAGAETRSWPRRLGLPLAMAAILGANWAWGAARLAGAATTHDTNVRLRIVQPNVPQAEKWKAGNQSWIFSRLIETSRAGPAGSAPGLQGITHLIWPESSLPFLLARTETALDVLARLLPEGTTFIAGAARADRDGSGRARIYNSIFVMDDEARPLTRYDKIRLVPFGEFLPLQRTLEAIGLEQLTRIRGGFTAGRGIRYLQAPGAPPFSPLICYEIIFPGRIRAEGKTPAWMLNVTNDDWFGQTSGPYQHFHQARVRAVEEGLPLVRAANSGISAIVDGHGRVLARLPLGATGAIDSALPRALSETPYVRWGRLIELGLLLGTALLWLAAIGSERRRRERGGD